MKKTNNANVVATPHTIEAGCWLKPISQRVVTDVPIGRGAQASFLSTWQNWFASDALGIVTIAPLVIGLASVTREPPAQKETIEGLIALASLIIVSHRHCTAARAVDNGCADRAAVSDPVVDRGTLSTSLRCGGGLYRHPRNCLDHDNRNRLLR